MYLYYDKTGTLKEIINDEALRQGNYNANTIYVYVEEKQDSINYIRVNYLLPSDLIVGPQDYNTRESKMIPFDEKRDLQYFKYNTTYNFIKIVMTADENANGPLDMGGLVHCELRAFNLSNQQILKLGTLNFQVELDEVAQQKYIALLPQEYMSLSDYRYLELLIGEGTGYIKLDESTGTLTDDELTQANKVYCVIKYDNNLYYKVSQSLGMISFQRIYWTTSNGKEVRHKNTISVNESTRQYIITFNDNNFYDSNAVDDLLPGYIELTGNGGTLTADQLLEVQKNYCVINLDDTLFYKAYENESIWQFYKIPEGGTNLLTNVATFNGKALPVSKGSGSWHWEERSFTTYPKYKIDTLLPGYIVLEQNSGTLTADQLLEAAKNYCVIKFTDGSLTDSVRFYKVKETATDYIFAKEKALTSNGTQTQVTYSEDWLEVDKASGVYIIIGGDLDYYTKKGVDELVSDKAEIIDGTDWTSSTTLESMFTAMGVSIMETKTGLVDFGIITLSEATEIGLCEYVAQHLGSTLYRFNAVGSKHKISWDGDLSSNPTIANMTIETWETWRDKTTDLPSLTGNAGKVLKVNSGATGVEWDSESKEIINGHSWNDTTKLGVVLLACSDGSFRDLIEGVIYFGSISINSQSKYIGPALLIARKLLNNNSYYEINIISPTYRLTWSSTSIGIGTATIADMTIQTWAEWKAA